MSYIAFDLDALNRAPSVARAAGCREEDVISGLVRLWAWCFREETDQADATHIAGHFGMDCTKALVSFGFLEPRDSGFRVRGAARYLRIKSAQRTAAERTNQRRKTARTSDAPPDGLPHAPPHAPLDGQATLLHRAPSTEHRAPNRKASAPAVPSPTREASDALCRDFAEATGSAYLWQGAKDGTALAALLKAATLDEVRARWRRGLQAPDSEWASCRTVAQLRTKWNDLAGAATERPVSVEHLASRAL